MIQAVEDMGKLDNTLIIYINGDNGTSAEGGPLGTPNEVAFFNGVAVPVEVQMKMVRRLGHGADLQPHVGGLVVGLRHALHLVQAERLAARRHPAEHGVSWPGRIKDKGGLREQFSHVIDIVPTILEASGIPAPEYVDGIKQAPIEGTSFAYTFDAKNAKAPSRHKTQYFEMMGQWALYHEGWLLPAPR